MIVDKLYNALEIPKYSPHNEIKRAYRQQAKKFHPDKNSSPEAKVKFQQIEEAYRILIKLTPNEVQVLENRVDQKNQYTRERRTYRTYNQKVKKRKKNPNYERFLSKQDKKIKIIKSAFIISIFFPLTVGISSFWGINGDDPLYMKIAFALSIGAFLLYAIGLFTRYNPQKKY